MADEIEKKDDFGQDDSPKTQQINFADIPDVLPLAPRAGCGDIFLHDPSSDGRKGEVHKGCGRGAV